MDDASTVQLLFVYCKQVLDSLLSVVNLHAVWLGVAAERAWSFITPSKEGGGLFSTMAGHWMSRLCPFVAPLAATVVTVALEWDGKFASVDAVRGILSGFFSEFVLRVYYKLGKGL